MKCPICGKGTLKKGNNQKNKVFLVRRNAKRFSRIKETMFGVYLGEFPAEICDKCNESFTDEKTTRAIDEEAKKKGIWGLGKKTKTHENQRFHETNKIKDFVVQKITGFSRNRKFSGAENSKIFELSGHRKSKVFSRVTKTGNSLAVRIPKEIADFLKLKEGNDAYIHPEKDRLIIGLS